LTDEDFTTSTESAKPLVTSNVIILEEVKKDSNLSSGNQIKSSGKDMIVSTAELLTEHDPNSQSEKLTTLKPNPIQETSSDSGKVENSVFLPASTILVPVLPPTIRENQARPGSSGPLFAGPIVERVAENQNRSEIAEVSTLPSAPKIPLDIREPVNPNPLPFGAFAFVPIHNSSAHLSEILAAKN